jgi:uncharacterized protein (DUF433 family)/DNA-binding transcriptional MerR regulator
VAKRASRLVVAASEGCYDATRAAALSGVPKSTIYYWASHEVVVPSVSPVREKLWSYADLMALRVVSWLRHPKNDVEGERPGSPMREVRRALAELDQNGLDLWAPQTVGRSPLLVDRSGKIHIRIADGVRDLSGQSPLDPEWLDLLGPFDQVGGNGPDLVAPREHIRIVPARVAGEPHVAGSRLTTLTLAALAARGVSADRIADMYDVDAVVVDEAVDLEEQLAGLRTAA